MANDFFFSGHTGIAVYGAVEIGRLKGWKGIWLGVAIATFEATSVLILRALYTMDVLTGVLAAICAAYLADRIGLAGDRLLRQIGARRHNSATGFSLSLGTCPE